MKKLLTLIIIIFNIFILTTTVSYAIDFAADEMTIDGWRFETSPISAPPEAAIDGDGKTHFHSRIDPKVEPPHYFTIILPDNASIGGLRYTPRQDELNIGTITEYNLYASNDGKEYVLLAKGKWNDIQTVKTIYLTYNVVAKYLKLEALSTVAGYLTIGEIRLLKPDSRIETLSLEDSTEELRESVLTPLKGDFAASATSFQDGIGPENAIDGNANSFWHSKFNPQKDELPISIIIDMKDVHTIDAISYLPRQDSYQHGTFYKCSFSTSVDGQIFDFLDTVTWDNNKQEKFLRFNSRKARVIKIEILEANEGFATAAEIGIIQSEKNKRLDKEEKLEKYTFNLSEKIIDIEKYGVEKKTIPIKVAPFLENGNVMVPLRSLFEAMGAEVVWIDETQNIKIKNSYNEFVLRIEDDRIYKNGIRYNIMPEPELINDTTMVPLSFVFEHFNYIVMPQQDKNKIIILNK